MDSTLPFKIIHGLLAIGVITGVLLQPGKGGGLSGALGGGGGSQTSMAKKKGKEEKMARLTSAVAIMFMISAIILAFVVGR